MNVDVTVNGRPRKVAVEPADQPGTFTITMNGKKRVVDVSWVDADTVSLIDGRTVHEVRIHSRGETGFVGVQLGGRVYEAVVSDSRVESRSAAKRTTGGVREPGGASTAAGIAIRGGGSHAIRAPMPGRVVRVLVGAGDRVVARQALVVVEAMKMEHELRTPAEGTVTQVSVVAGSTVETGAVLLVIGDQDSRD